MSRFFKELDYRPTPLGALTLRWRMDPVSGEEIYEIKLGDDFLMSSKFTTSEKALATVALDALTDGKLDVVVGGLGLGNTAATALNDARVQSLLVVDALQEVIEWHIDGLLPLSNAIVSDPRTRLIQGNFFDMAKNGNAFDPECPGRRFDAILLDVDHSPSRVLHPANLEFYTIGGLSGLREQLKPGGIFALWSNEPPEESFTQTLRKVFSEARAEEVRFYNPLQENEAIQSVYVAQV
ncbi:spermidine synthase (plasmid) [Agrobacterium tumefaciens]|nr:spermidine synthase [Agrobacterium tumefaciens]